MLVHPIPSAADDVEDQTSWSMPTDVADAVDELRALAATGQLADAYHGADSVRRRRLTGAAIAVAWQLVFLRLTRVQEHRRGHHVCARGLSRLADGCLDRFYDDLQAVVDDLLHAKAPIEKLEGWMVSRLKPATVDAHRRRRGARGALQRPRLPQWLAKELDNDGWLCHLALEILIWVGVSTTAGTALWPLDSWAERRAAITGDIGGSTAAVVNREVDVVCSVMQTRPQWYQDFVERPLGAKVPPVAPAFLSQATVVLDPPALVLSAPHEAYEAALTDMAATVLDATLVHVASDPSFDLDRDLMGVLGPIMVKVFGTDGVDELADPPRGGDSALDRVPALVGDAAELARITRVVRDIIDDVLVGRGQR